MGMTIEEIQRCLKEYHSGFTGYAGNFQEVVDGALDIMCKYQQLQADYESRLKADMVAMLTDIQTEIKELWDNRYDVWLDNQYYIGKSDTLGEVDEVIQQKIDALKGEQA